MERESRNQNLGDPHRLTCLRFFFSFFNFFFYFFEYCIVVHPKNKTRLATDCFAARRAAGSRPWHALHPRLCSKPTLCAILSDNDSFGHLAAPRDTTLRTQVLQVLHRRQRAMFACEARKITEPSFPCRCGLRRKIVGCTSFSHANLRGPITFLRAHASVLFFALFAVSLLDN